MANLQNPSNVLYQDSTTGQPVAVTDALALPVSANGAASKYETVAASQSDQILGATGAVGDYLAGLLIVPATTGAGSVSIKDGNGSAISVFVTGTLADLRPIYIPLGIKCTAVTTPGWKVTTGANVSAVGIGNFT